MTPLRARHRNRSARHVPDFKSILPKTGASISYCFTPDRPSGGPPRHLQLIPAGISSPGCCVDPLRPQIKHNGLGAYRCMDSAMGVVSAIDAPCVGHEHRLGAELLEVVLCRRRPERRGRSLLVTRPGGPTCRRRGETRGMQVSRQLYKARMLAVVAVTAAVIGGLVGTAAEGRRPGYRVYGGCRPGVRVIGGTGHRSRPGGSRWGISTSLGGILGAWRVSQSSRPRRLGQVPEPC